MIISAAFLSIIATAVQPQPQAITVVGHAWAPFISPMGEPFGPKTEGDDTLATWFRQADHNHDGFLTHAEMQTDAERFFAKLDTDHDGEIDPDELAHYEWQVAPEIQVNSRLRRERGQKPDPKDEAKERRRAKRGDDRLDTGFHESSPGAAGFFGATQPREEEPGLRRTQGTSLTIRRRAPAA